MEKVTVYKCADGSLVADKAEAIVKDTELAVRAVLDKWADDTCWYDMSKGDIADVLYDGWNALSKDVAAAKAAVRKSYGEC